MTLAAHQQEINLQEISNLGSSELHNANFQMCVVTVFGILLLGILLLIYGLIFAHGRV